MNPEDVLTRCCQAKWYRKSRANYRCTNCDKDFTIELVLIMQHEEDNILPQGNKPESDNVD